MPLLWEKDLLNVVPNRDHFPSRGLKAVAVGLLVYFFVSPRRAELLGEQKGSLALAIEVCTLCVGGNMRICAGAETTLFSGGG